MAAVVFMAVDPQARKVPQPEIRFVEESMRRDFVQHAVGNADIDHTHIAAKQPAGQQQMAGLAAEEGNRRPP